jgi:hypothetical protein
MSESYDGQSREGGRMLTKSKGDGVHDGSNEGLSCRSEPVGQLKEGEQTYGHNLHDDQARRGTPWKG